MENFKLLHSVLIYDTIPVHKYVSSRTGLTVVIAETDGPLISARFCVATDILGEDAFRYILKELIFLGSEEFPQDFQSLINNRCLVTKINPWIANEDSSYIIEAFAEEDLLTVLPIVAEYILYPLLREEDYKVKIHRVTEDGKHAGEMYNQLEELTPFLAPSPSSILLKALYSKKISHTSLIKHPAKELRESITLAKVRDYHKEFYRPENLNIMIAGSVKPEAVFQALKKLEEKIVSKGNRGPLQRPFQRLAPPLTEDVKEIVMKYPDDEVAIGQFYTAWRTVSSINESYTLRAISMLIEYLMLPPEEPLTKEFVKNDDTFASYVDHDVTEDTALFMYITFNGVPVDKLPAMRTKLQSVLENIFENKNINMESMKAIITKNKFQSLISAEGYSSSNVLNIVAPYVVHGSNEDFQHISNPLTEVNNLLREPQSFWLNLLKKYFIDNKCAVLQSVPCNEEKMDTGKSHEDHTTDTLTENIAQVDLKEKGDVIDAAQCNKEKLTPNPIVAVPLPNLNSIKFYNIERYNSNSDDNGRIDLSQTPVFTYFDHVKTSIVFMEVLLDTSEVPVDLQYYLPLFVRSLMELSIERDGVIIPHDEVEKQLVVETAYKWADTQCYKMPYLAFVTVEVENAKFETGLRWLRELLYRTVFTADRLKDIVMKEINYLSQPGSINVYDAISKMCFPKDSSVVIGSNLQQRKFLKQLMEKLNSGDSKEVLDSIEQIRSIITEPSKMYLHIVGNLDDLKNPVESINKFLPPEVKITKKRQKLRPVFSYSFLEFTNSSRGCIIGVEDINSNCFYQMTKCAISYVDPDYPALCLYTKYLELKEDSVQKIWINIEVEKGILRLSYLRKSPQLVEIYKRIKEHVTGLLEHRGWDKSLLESARRSLLYRIIDDESSILYLKMSSRIAFLHDLEYTFHRNLFDSIQKVTTEDLHRVGERYIAPLYDPENTRMAIVTHSSRLTKMAEEFKRLGFDLTICTSVGDSFLSEL